MPQPARCVFTDLPPQPGKSIIMSLEKLTETNGSGLENRVAPSLWSRAGDYLSSAASSLKVAGNRAARTFDNTLTRAKYATLGAAVLGVLAYGARDAKAAPLGNPLADVHDSSPSSSFAKPAGSSNLTCADGDISTAIWYMGDTNGKLYRMNGSQSTPLATIDTGVSGLSGVALTSLEGDMVLSAGKILYTGKVAGTAWNQISMSTISGLTSDITDVDYALGSFFITTVSNGIRKVNMSGMSTQIDI